MDKRGADADLTHYQRMLAQFLKAYCGIEPGMPERTVLMVCVNLIRECRSIVQRRKEAISG